MGIVRSAGPAKPIANMRRPTRLRRLWALAAFADNGCSRRKWHAILTSRTSKWVLVLPGVKPETRADLFSLGSLLVRVKTSARRQAFKLGINGGQLWSQSRMRSEFEPFLGQL